MKNNSFVIGDFKYKPLLAATIIALSGFLFIPTASAEGLPGTVDGVGNHFEITNSSYLNVTLDSSEIVSLRIESVPQMVTMVVNPSSVATLTQMTLAGLNPDTTYYKYEDSYHNLIQFTTNSDGSYSYEQDLSILHIIFIQTHSSTKFIKDDSTGGDCLLIGLWDLGTKTCTLNTNISQTIQIDNDGVTLNGNNFIVSGFHTGSGIFLNGRSGVVIKNLNIKEFAYGIFLQSSSGNTLTGNTTNSDNFGIVLSESSNNIVTSNILSDNISVGIALVASNNNTLADNIASNNPSTGINLNSSTNNTLTGNTVNSNGFYGIGIIFSSNNTLADNVVQENGNNFDNYDIMVLGSSDNDCNNSITNTTGSGGRPIKYFNSAVSLNNETFSELILCNADHSNISDIIIDGSPTRQNNGLLLVRTDFSTITNVNSSNNFSGIRLESSSSNSLVGNTVSNNKYPGIYLSNSSSNNTLRENTASNNNNTGIYIGSPSSNNNQIYHNNLISNSPQQAIVEMPSNTGNAFSISSPDGGNYWSDYDTPAESCTDANSDNFCDTPYVFQGGQDNLPWVIPIVAEKTLSEKAAELAKLLIDGPYLGDGDTWGGKGWDSNLDKYVSPNTILVDGYDYWNNKLKKIVLGGKGIDCSGLVEWAFNYAFNPSKNYPENVIRYPGADNEYRYNSEPIVDSLQPGDLLFFDGEAPANHMDHVAMYVGNFVHNSNSFDVMQAASPDAGIIASNKDDLITLPAFLVVNKPIRRVVVSPDIGGQIKAGSPIDLVVTDPKGFTITPTTTIQTSKEYLQEVPGELYYSERLLGTDGHPDDIVYWPTKKIGNYIIEVLPEIDTLPTDTYSLEFTSEGQMITLANDIPISQIPSKGYGVTVGETGTIGTFIPVSIDVKPGSYPNTINLGSGGNLTVAIFGTPTFDVTQISPGTVTLSNALVKLKGNGQPMTSYSDVNGDSILDLVMHVFTEALQLTKADVQAKLSGSLLNGQSIKGSDLVRIVP